MQENSLERKTEISNLQFLVHPGYIIKSHPRARVVYDLDKLMRGYEEKARALGPNEMMVIFAPSSRDYFVKHVRTRSEDYVEVINNIKNTLGKRAIVLSSDGETDPQNREAVWDEIKNIASARGFVFSKKMTAEAYGEYLDLCVKEVAKNMHQASGMSKENLVNIRANLTDHQFHTSLEDKTDPSAAYIHPRTKIDFTGLKKRKLDK